ncbi:response regulator [Vagococcus vulneris]|uniref:Transcriptional regulatory protein n=2 Tax=Vagococcus vulneris TaxID=1977869 RepID=A0A429ZRX3_9ENTE|nr:response regulator [Vagococcus vulneris]
MVASLNQQFIEQLFKVNILDNVRSVDEARHILSQQPVDLMLLDVYMPGTTGIEFLRELKQRDQQIPVILITAADDQETVNQAINYRVVDYLIKPFTFERFKLAFNKFLALYDVTHQLGRTNQAVLDQFFNHVVSETKPVEARHSVLPKGLSRPTLEKIVHQINQMADLFSTEELAEKVALSRISTKKYILFLLDIGYLNESMEYRDVGRPITLYSLNHEHASAVMNYI